MHPLTLTEIFNIVMSNDALSEKYSEECAKLLRFNKSKKPQILVAGKWKTIGIQKFTRAQKYIAAKIYNNDNQRRN